MKLAYLVLEDGRIFEGNLVGNQAKITSGELIFNTSMTGYQEILTDPSYSGQIVVFTYPHIGNYGTDGQFDESGSLWARGLVVRDLSMNASNFSSTQKLDSFLGTNDLCAITGVDTRALTKHLRQYGSLRGAFGIADPDELLELARSEPTTSEINHVEVVSASEPYQVGGGDLHIVAYDFGIKSSITKQLARFAKVTVIPFDTPADEAMELHPDGIFLSNGPGDPKILTGVIDQIQNLLGQVPIFGICLGHQLLAEALGAKTEKLKFGHHGANHPVKNLNNGEVEITSQNHNFAVIEDSLRDIEITHRNLNDGVIEGIASLKYPAFSVQHHPEASPGPHDSWYMFKKFFELMEQESRDRSLKT